MNKRVLKIVGVVVLALFLFVAGGSMGKALAADTSKTDIHIMMWHNNIPISGNLLPGSVARFGPYSANRVDVSLSWTPAYAAVAISAAYTNTPLNPFYPIGSFYGGGYGSCGWNTDPSKSFYVYIKNLQTYDSIHYSGTIVLWFN